MKITASGGTDGGNIVLFWPDNLPDGADAALKDDPTALVETLDAEGKLVRFPCDSDGGYTLAVFLGTPVPDDLIARCKEVARRPAMQVRGEGYFGGMEYVFKHDSSFLQKHPHMCGRVSIPQGTYAATVYETEFPDEFEADWIETRVGARAKRTWKVHGIVAACATAAVLGSVISVCFLPWRAWFYVAGAAVLLVVIAVGLSRTKAYRQVTAARAEFERSYPSYVLHLT